ncbi:MAG: Ni/Fe hydrogenase subunit alpha [Acidimicrobiia bacterium]|nr:Ni/Fe hydrogenase subunit alpha [Acidimicrobiia bacterium]
MSHRSRPERLLENNALARVEGEGALRVEIRNGQVADVQLRIYEPPRFFEAFLRGRSYTEPPDLTARICGICPVAYQMSACSAIEAACGITVDGPLRDLRRLMYCGEWIESHTLHIYLLHAPDFLGHDSALTFAAADRAALERGLALKKIGNEAIELIGGRAVHPINVRVGGFYRVPSRRDLAPLRDRLLQARDLAQSTVSWVAGFDFPDHEVDTELVALQHPDEYAVMSGRIVSTGGLELGVEDFADHVAEHHVAHSTALHARLLERGRYLVGPLARFALNFDQLQPLARSAAREVGIGPDCRNPFRSIVIRAIEVLHACDLAVELIDRYEQPDRTFEVAEPRAAIGHGATEAPRGLLYHRYGIDDDGLVTDAVIVPPTSQNQPAIEHDLWHLVEENLDLDDEPLRRRAEAAIRNYDPCISCATHFLDLTVVRS